MEFAAANNIHDPAQAMREFERANPHPEMVTGSSVSHRASLRLPAEPAYRPEAELAALLGGDENGFLDRAINATISDVRALR